MPAGGKVFYMTTTTATTTAPSHDTCPVCTIFGPTPHRTVPPTLADLAPRELPCGHTAYEDEEVATDCGSTVCIDCHPIHLAICCTCAAEAAACEDRR